MRILSLAFYNKSFLILRLLFSLPVSLRKIDDFAQIRFLGGRAPRPREEIKGWGVKWVVGEMASEMKDSGNFKGGGWS